MSRNLPALCTPASTLHLEYAFRVTELRAQLDGCEDPAERHKLETTIAMMIRFGKNLILAVVESPTWSPSTVHPDDFPGQTVPDVIVFEEPPF
jgi:hypothetical protein